MYIVLSGNKLILLLSKVTVAVDGAAVEYVLVGVNVVCCRFSYCCFVIVVVVVVSVVVFVMYLLFFSLLRATV